MSADITPALTAEEWAVTHRPQRYREQPSIKRHSDGTLTISRDQLVDGEWRPGDTVTIDAGDDASLRALGALALVGYFAHEDVQLLYNDAERGLLIPEEVDALRNLAARLAALLPQETP